MAPRPGSVLIILSKNMVKNMRVRPAPSPRGRTRPVIANRFFDALRIRIYALRNALRVFTVFYGGVNDLSIFILLLLNLTGGWWVLYSIVDKSVCSVTTGERGSNPPSSRG